MIAGYANGIANATGITNSNGIATQDGKFCKRNYDR